MARSRTLALVGSESLMGREIRDLLSANTLGQDLRLVAAAGEEPGKLTVQAGEPALVNPLEGQNLELARVILLAGAVESVAKRTPTGPAHAPGRSHL